MAISENTPVRDLVISQGATFRKQLIWKTGNPRVPVDLTGATAKLQVRINVSSTTVLLELTTENGGITLGGTAGTIELYLNPTVTNSIAWSIAAYDMLVFLPGGDIVRLIHGNVSVEKLITR